MSIDADMVERARRGDERATEALIRAFQQPIGRFVVAELGSREHYLDVCQAVFVKMVRGLPRLRSADGFEAWLFQIARNTAADQRRRDLGRQRLFVALTDEHDASSAPSEAADERPFERLHAAMARLDSGQHRILALAMEQPRSYEELAQLTGSSVASVRNRLFRVRQRLRSLMGNCEDENG